MSTPKKYQEHLQYPRPQALSDYVADHIKDGATSGMSVSYEIAFGINKYFYDLQFDTKNNLELERLTKVSGSNHTLVVERTHDSYSFGRGFIRSKSKDSVDALFKEHYQDYTLLAILQYGLQQNTIELKDSLVAILSFIDGQNLNVGAYIHNEHFNANRPYHATISYGIGSPHFIPLLQDLTKMLTLFLKVLFPKVHATNYVVEKLDDKHYEYHLEIIEQRDGALVPLNYKQWSTSYRKTIEFANIINDAKVRHVVVLDDFSLSLHPQTQIKLLSLLAQQSKAQILFSTSSISYIDHVEPRSLFFVRYSKEKGHFIENIATKYNVRSEHKISHRYLSGQYGDDNHEFNPQLHKSNESYQQLIQDLGVVKKKSDPR